VFADGFGDEKMAVGLRAQVKQAVISTAAAGDNTIVAAVAGKLITMVALLLVSTGATNITVKDGTGGAALSGAMPLAAGVPLFLDEKSDLDYYSTSNVANNLVLNNSAAVQISGTVWYVQW
jgi:hypothetical protein